MGQTLALKEYEILRQLLHTYPNLISLAIKLDFAVTTIGNDDYNSTIEQYIGYVTNKDSLYKNKKTIISIIRKADIDNETIKHIILHELTHLSEMHTDIEICKRIIEEEFNQKFVSTIYTVACEYTVAKIMQQVFNSVTEYEKLYIDITEQIVPLLKHMDLKDINHLAVYRMLYDTIKNMKQNAKKKNKACKIPQNCQDGSCTGDNDAEEDMDQEFDDDGNGISNNNTENEIEKELENATKEHDSIGKIIEQLKRDIKKANKQNKNNNQDANSNEQNGDKDSDAKKKTKKSSKQKGNQHSKTAVDTYKFDDVKSAVKLNRTFLVNENIISIDYKPEFDPLASLKAKLRDLFRGIIRYDWYEHDFITQPEFEYFIPQIKKLQAKNDSFVLVVDVSGSIAAYIKELLDFISEYSTYISYIIVHDAAIVQTIDLTNKAKVKISDAELNITAGGTSFKDSYEFIKNHKLDKDKIILHITDLFTDYEDIDYAVNNFDRVIYVVAQNEYNLEFRKRIEFATKDNFKKKFEFLEYDGSKMKKKKQVV